MVAHVRKAEGDSVRTEGADGLGPRAARFRQRHARALMVAGAALLFGGTGYAAALGALPVWAWLVSGVAGLASLSVTFRPWARQTEPVPARSLVWEVRQDGLSMAVGCSGAEAFEVLLTAGRASEDTRGFILLDSPDRPAEPDLAAALVRSVAESTCPQQAAARFLHFLDAQFRVDCAMVGLWQAPSGLFSFVAAGFEAPAVIQGNLSHRLDHTTERQTEGGPRKLSFGVHRLSPGERWLFHTAPLVGRQSLWARGYSPIRLLRHACESQAMPNEEWVDHLLERSLKAHKDSLPPGALLLSVVCVAPEDAAADTWPPPVQGGPDAPRNGTS